MKLRLGARKLNIERIKKFIKEAKRRNAKIAIIPSLFNIGPVMNYYPREKARSVIRNYAERVPGPTTEQLAIIALEGGLYVVAGPMVERAGPRLFLSTVIIAPDGTIIGKYRKIALAREDEEVGISPGREIVHFTLDRKYGIASEDDLLFPEIVRCLSLTGANAILASIRITRENGVYKHIAVARSIENELPVIAIGGIVEDIEGNLIEVPSMVIDPHEGVLTVSDHGEEQLLITEIPLRNSRTMINRWKVGIESLCKLAKRIE